MYEKVLFESILLFGPDFDQQFSIQTIAFEESKMKIQRAVFSFSKDGAASVLFHKNSNKSSNILLQKPLSAPSIGRY